jgi:hypothetical protein
MENAKPGFVTEAAINFAERHLIDTTCTSTGVDVNHVTGGIFVQNKKQQKDCTMIIRFRPQPQELQRLEVGPIGRSNHDGSSGPALT